ncbi:helix-turn-helix protein [compost metagenome]
MELKRAFGKMLCWLRGERGFTQEDFSIVSSRTYISSLERGIYSPTLEKLDDIASVMKVHPITLLIGTYALKEERSVDELLSEVRSQIEGYGLVAGFDRLVESASQGDSRL